MILNGIGASDGLGLGNAVCIRESVLDYTGVIYAGAEAEKARLLAAVDAFCRDTERMTQKMSGQVGQHEAEILSGHIAMLSDPFLRAQLEEKVEQGSVAEQAVDEVCAFYDELFSQADDELVRQRAADVRDIRNRLLGLLLHVKSIDLSALAPHSVLVAPDLTPSMTVGLRAENVAAIVTQSGGRTSHSAILARALGIPAVLGVPNLMNALSDGDRVLVNGGTGEVILNPDAAQAEAYRIWNEESIRERQSLQAYRTRPTENADGRRVSLYANIGSTAQLDEVSSVGAEGIGLFRTEFLFMERSDAPGEEEQYQAYRAVAGAMPGRDVLIRTLDIGGDKHVPYLSVGKEENPFLGYRAIRYCLDRPDFFSTQLKALLRAGAEYQNVKIMLPLITSVEEIRAARALLEKCKAELQEKGKAFDRNISLGVMIETPAAVQLADQLAKEADFFSIGTNDLTQYTLAVDRGNAKVEQMYDPLHPAVLRSIRQVISAAHKAQIPVGMCGEAAADPKMIPLLLAWGLDEFSVSAPSVLTVRKWISQWSDRQAGELAQRVMELVTTEEIHRKIEKMF